MTRGTTQMESTTTNNERVYMYAAQHVRPLAASYSEPAWTAGLSEDTRTRMLEFQPQPFFLDITKTDLGEYLQLTCKRILEAPNWMSRPDYEQVIREFCTPTFRVAAGFPETNLIATTLPDHIRNFNNFLEANPKYRIEVQNTSLFLDARMGRAVVYMSTKVSGLFESQDTTRESINKVHWRRHNDGKWWVYEMSSLRGPGQLPF